MKGYVLLSVFIFFSLAGIAQVYNVVRLKGIIYHNGKPLKEGDTFNDTDKLNTADRTAAVRVINNKQGSFVISFQSGIQQSNFPAKKRSEFFELAVGNYLRMFNPVKSALITKGAKDFDWFDFFYQLSSGGTSRQLLLVDGEHVSTSSAVFPADTPYRLFSCIINNPDSVLIEIPIVKNQMIFTAKSFPDSVFNWKLKIGYIDDGGKFKLSAINENPIASRFVPIIQLENMAKFFFQDWKRYYSNKNVAENEFRDWLNVIYGKTMPGLVDNIIQTCLP